MAHNYTTVDKKQLHLKLSNEKAIAALKAMDNEGSNSRASVNNCSDETNLGSSSQPASLTSKAAVKKPRKPTKMTNIRNSKLSFPWRLHHMLTDAEKEDFEDVVSWLPGGRAFKVHQTDNFVATIMPRYFNQTKYKSFGRQLHIYGFTWVAKGEQKGSYFHPNFIRSDMSCCLNIFRKKLKATSSQSTEVLEDTATDLSLEVPSTNPSPNSDFLLSSGVHPWSNSSNITSESMDVGPTRLSEFMAVGPARLVPIDSGVDQSSSVVSMNPGPQSSSIGMTPSFNDFGVASSSASIEGGVFRATGNTNAVVVAGADNGRFGSLLQNEPPPVPVSILPHERSMTNAPAMHHLRANFRRCVRYRMPSSVPAGSQVVLNGPIEPFQSKPSAQQGRDVFGFNMKDLEPRPIEEIVAKPQRFQVDGTESPMNNPFHGFHQHPW